MERTTISEAIERGSVRKHLRPPLVRAFVYAWSHGATLPISACASRAACATAPSPSSIPCSRRATSCKNAGRCEGASGAVRLTQERHLMVSEAKCLHVRGSDMNGCSFPRAMARSTVRQNF